MLCRPAGNTFLKLDHSYESVPSDSSPTISNHSPKTLKHNFRLTILFETSSGSNKSVYFGKFDCLVLHKNKSFYRKPAKTVMSLD